MTALVDRLEQLAGGATPGPWAASGHDPHDWNVFAINGRPGDTVANDVCSSQDAALIVELRNALPALLAAVRAAQVLAGDPFGQLNAPSFYRLREALSPLFGEDTTP